MIESHTLEAYRKSTDQALEEHLQSCAQSLRLVQAMRYSLFAGGKRIRPLLAFASCQASGGSMEQALPLACALEMIHTYSLIHDDLPAMDDDDVRRGHPTNHKVFGEALAILAGDALLTEAFCVLTRASWAIPPQSKNQIVHIVAQAAGANGMVAGQALDLIYESQEFDEKILESIHRNKTGRLLWASVVAGGCAGGAKESVQEILQEYGQSIGLAFQIADDVLDLTVTTQELGKDSGSDLKKKKATYPALFGIEKSRDKAKSLLNRALQAIAPLGEKGDFLAFLARRIVERRN